MHKIRQLFVLLIFIVSIFPCVLSIVGGQKTKLPPKDDPVVFVNHVGRYSRVQGYHNSVTGLYTFRGIKYADMPIRENRFLRPKFKRLIGDVPALKNSPPCPQPDFYDERKIIGDEDCLALNIFTPKMPDESTGLPVLIWIHGGGYRFGSAAQYDAEPLVQDKIVFVPIQYRLGTLGILGEGSKEFGGNVAMFDMHAALQWVKEYISFFGGNPKQIQVMGHGSGGSAAMYLAQTPMGRDSLNGVVSMSGSSLYQYSNDENATSSTQEIANVHDCPSSNEVDLINCMRNKSTEEIISQDSKIQFERLMGKNMIKSMNGMLTFSPNIEQKDDSRGLPGFITDKPENILKQKTENKMPLLIGVCSDETANGIQLDEINKIFNTGTEFLKIAAGTLQLESLVKATKQHVIKALGLPSLEDYLKIADGITPEKILEKLIESTTDIFFNVPSVMTADLWGKYSSAPAFFYQFHQPEGSESSGKKFLRPLPLVSKANSKGKTSHGDELGFLFEINDVWGNKINETSPKSSRVLTARKNFISLIHNFAYFNSSSSNFRIGNVSVNAFSAQASNFIKVSEKLEIEDNFRFCQLSLYGALLQAPQKISCEFLSQGLKKISTVPKVENLGGFLRGKQIGF